jgi:hypothetical protein
MGKKQFIILGNGFTIDLLNFIGKNKEIDVKNLFSSGDKVPWPTDKIPGYLSYKHTPNLWQVGVSSTMDSTKSLELIEEIITTANMYTEIKRNKNGIDPQYLDSIKQSRYIKAYRELASYLKHLFIYYNGLIEDNLLKGEKLDAWGWYKFFKKLQDDSEVEEVIIVTYNYDIFLERIFMLNDIKFMVEGLEENESKFKIIKPHGSISFAHNTLLPYEYNIKYEQIFPEAKIMDFNLRYNELSQNYLVDAIIPPAGSSNRINVDWAHVLRKSVLEYAEKMSFSDKVIVSGISYWHVDREEIDELLVNIHPGVDFIMINPSVPRTFSAVIESIFKNYIVYSNSNNLGEV